MKGTSLIPFLLATPSHFKSLANYYQENKHSNLVSTQVAVVFAIWKLKQCEMMRESFFSSSFIPSRSLSSRYMLFVCHQNFATTTAVGKWIKLLDFTRLLSSFGGSHKPNVCRADKITKLLVSLSVYTKFHYEFWPFFLLLFFIKTYRRRQGLFACVFLMEIRRHRCARNSKRKYFA